MTRPPTSNWRRWVLLLFTCSLFGGCGGGSAPPPRSTLSLLFAVFQGSGPGDTTPSAGDFLFLFFSGDVSLVTGKVIDDDDLQLSAGSLGTGPLSTLIDARSVRVRLGTGAGFLAGTDTVRLLETQDAIQDTSARLLDEGAPVITSLTDGARPTVDSLTLNGIPSVLNGTGAAEGILQVPVNGFTVDATYSDTAPFTNAPGINTAASLLTANVAVNVNSNSVSAGTNLFGSLTQTSVGPGAFTLTVPANVEFPQGDPTLSLTVVDNTNNLSIAREFTFRVKAINDDIRPFEPTAKAAQQTWFLDLARDLDTVTSLTTNNGVTILLSATATPNSVSDFLEDLIILGLRAPTPIANVIGSKDSNEVTLDLLKTKLQSELAAFHPGVNVQFTFTDPGAFPANMALVPYKDHGSSRISIGAASDVSGVLGIALFDPNNAFQNDNTLPPGDYKNVTVSTRLGVFPHTLFTLSINVIGSRFRTLFDPIIDHRGIPVGEHVVGKGDRQRLIDLTNNTGTPDTRQNQIETAIDSFARFLAVVVAHECGHSVGLVKDGAMPAGLYGGDAVHFPGSTAGHISLTSTTIFPAGATEIMAPSLSLRGVLHESTAFNPLILAYLRERALYDN